MVAFTKLYSEDRVLNMVQDNLVKSINPIAQNPIINGHILTSISLASGNNKVTHGLNRPLLGWYITRLRANETIYDTQDTNPNPSSNLQLVASGAVVVDIAVF